MKRTDSASVGKSSNCLELSLPMARPWQREIITLNFKILSLLENIYLPGNKSIVKALQGLKATGSGSILSEA